MSKYKQQGEILYVSPELEAQLAFIEYIKTDKWLYREEHFENEISPRMVYGCPKCGFSIKSLHDKRHYCPECGTKLED